MICLSLISLILTTKVRASDDTILNQGQLVPFSGILVDAPTYRQNSLYRLEAVDFKNNLNSYVKCVPIDDASTKLVSSTGLAVVLSVLLLGFIGGAVIH